MRTSIRLLETAAVATLAWGCSGKHSEPVELAFQALDLEVVLEPAISRVGENALWLELHGRDGKPLDGAVVEARVDMHAMGAMPAMGGPASVTSLGQGRYRADFALAMASTWQVEITAQVADGLPVRAEGSLTVGTPGLRLAAVEGADAGTAAERADPGHEPSHPAEFALSPERMQRIGVTTTTVERKSLPTRVRAVGRVVAAESGLVDVSLKVRGWATRVKANALGVPVAKGEVLFEVYSPDLLTAQQEYVEALRSQMQAHGTSAPDRADDLVRASSNRLRLWDVAPREIERLRSTREVKESIPIRAPITGYVVEKNLVEGGAFEPGARLYRIAPLSQVWIEADVYEAELEHVAIGGRATVTLAYLPGKSLEGRIAYIQPTLDAATRTARVRVEVDNRDLALRPNMYANVELEAPDVERLIVPESALLQAGNRSFVFQVLGEGRFRPRAVQVGRRIGEEVEILSGVSEGDRIVRSGTFLVAAESRLRSALEQW